jgi:hypothetical protein
MKRSAATNTGETIAERYRQLMSAGFRPDEASALIARSDGLDRHREGEAPPRVYWRWQEIARLEFLQYLADAGRLTDVDDLPDVSTPVEAVPKTGQRDDLRTLRTIGYASFG